MGIRTTTWIMEATNKRILTRENLGTAKKRKPSKRNSVFR